MTTAEREAVREFIIAAVRTEAAEVEARGRKEIDALLEEIARLDRELKQVPAGPAGRDGQPGSPGPQGEQGPRGVPGIPGEHGEKGTDGRDGRDGKDGRDGVASVDEIRAISVKAVDDRLEAEVQKQVDARFAALPTFVYRDTYKAGTEYRTGDFVTWGGQLYHCNEATTGKPGDSNAWSLAVRRGRDLTK